MIVLVETTLCLLKTLNLCLNLQITWIHRASGNVVFVVVVYILAQVIIIWHANLATSMDVFATLLFQAYLGSILITLYCYYPYFDNHLKYKHLNFLTNML